MTILKPVSRSPEKGAETLVWLATLPEGAIANGGYYFDKEHVMPSAEAQDMGAARGLWEVSKAQCATERRSAGRPLSRCLQHYFFRGRERPRLRLTALVTSPIRHNGFF
jgi:hypothetical protein